LEQLHILPLQRIDNPIPLPEFFLNNLQFSWVGKSIFAFHNVFKLPSQPYTFFPIQSHFKFEFILPSSTNITLQRLSFILAQLQFVLEVAHLPFQIYLQMGLELDAAFAEGHLRQSL
jgi:hypothetical protein